MRQKLKAIFGFDKVTYQAPSESFEQDTLFVEVTECHPNISQGRARAKVLGSLVCYSQKEKLPFGFFHKKIQLAPHTLTAEFFFQYETDNPASPSRMIDISERRMSFMYLYSAQYDPNQGELTSITFEGE